MFSETVRLYGVVGPRSAGKDTALDYLERFGFMRATLSDQLRVVAKERSLPFERPVLRGIGQELRTREGGDVLVKRVVAAWGGQRDRFAGGLAIGGHFTREESLSIQENGGTLLFIDAPGELRYGRELSRGRSDSPPSFDEFLEQDLIELEGLAGPNTPHINFARNLPGVVTLVNDTTIDALHRQIDTQLAIMPA